MYETDYLLFLSFGYRKIVYLGPSWNRIPSLIMKISCSHETYLSLGESAEAHVLLEDAESTARGENNFAKRDPGDMDEFTARLQTLLSRHGSKKTTEKDF